MAFPAAPRLRLSWLARPAPREVAAPFWKNHNARVTPNALVALRTHLSVGTKRARVILTPAELDQVQEGEILVCPITAPSWVPVFGRINAAVSDIGGIMAHAAIVSREYGLPAVVGTGFGTKEISTGQMIRVDGDNGRVEILD